MIWEIVFVLVILKLPVAYVCWVIWWAVKAEPELGERASTDGGYSWGRGATAARAAAAAERPARQPRPRTRAHAPTARKDDDMNGGNGSDMAGGIFGVAVARRSASWRSSSCRSRSRRSGWSAS